MVGKPTVSQRVEHSERGVQARSRALGNIQFVGHLYKHRMLTEKIMHNCIQTLLEDVRPYILLVCVWQEERGLLEGLQTPTNLAFTFLSSK